MVLIKLVMKKCIMGVNSEQKSLVFGYFLYVWGSTQALFYVFLSVHLSVHYVRPFIF